MPDRFARVLFLQRRLAVCLAIPGKLIAKTEEGGLLCGRVEFGGIVRTACLDFLPEAEVGDYVLVHVGFAISRINEEEAKASLAYLEELGELQTELGAVAEGQP
jgi:hydrogenase expression/formation protein HypC